MSERIITAHLLLQYWDTAFCDLKRDMYRGENIRLRNCSLHFNEDLKYYFIYYHGVTYGLDCIYNFKSGER